MYNLSPIQQGIQAGHAALKHALHYPEATQDFTRFDQTWIILNGGTSNQSEENPGTMEQHQKHLQEIGVKHTFFHEPDLNEALSAIAFLVDERVYDYKNYPDFTKPHLIMDINGFAYFPGNPYITSEEVNYLKEENQKAYEVWEEKMGGATNVALRDFLRCKELA